MTAIAQALRGAGDGIGRQNVGFYGSYFAMNWLIAHEPWIAWYWQTLAWSREFLGGGAYRDLLHPRRNLYQYALSNNVGGVDVDLDDLVTPNWGQRGAAPAPTPTPTPPEGTVDISGFKNENDHSELVVILNTGEVKNLYKVHDEKTGVTGWKRNADGTFAWESLGNPSK